MYHKNTHLARDLRFTLYYAIPALAFTRSMAFRIPAQTDRQKTSTMLLWYKKGDTNAQSLYQRSH